MKQHLSIDEINRLEEDCRKMRSAAIFDTFTSPFKRGKQMVSSLFMESQKHYGRLENKGLPVR